MTKHRLGKIAASIAVAPFYAVAWCVGMVAHALEAIVVALIAGFSDALWGKIDAAD